MSTGEHREISGLAVTDEGNGPSQGAERGLPYPLRVMGSSVIDGIRKYRAGRQQRSAERQEKWMLEDITGLVHKIHGRGQETQDEDGPRIVRTDTSLHLEMTSRSEDERTDTVVIAVWQEGSRDLNELDATRTTTFPQGKAEEVFALGARSGELEGSPLSLEETRRILEDTLPSTSAPELDTALPDFPSFWLL